MTFFSFIKNKWLNFTEFTEAIPEEASVRKLEAKITKEQQRRRTELINSIHLAASRAHLPNDQTVVKLLFKEKFLIEPELYQYSHNLGTIYLAKRDSGRIRIIFSGGIGNQAHAKRKEIIEGMQVRQQTWMGSSASVELRDEEEEFIIVERARKRGYNMSIIITMTILIFLSSLQAVTTAKVVNDHKPNIIDTSHHIDRHVQLFSMSSNIKSEHLHEISIPRHQAKGMWLPSHPITHLIRKHANSMTKTKIPDRKDASLKAWIQSPTTFSGSFSDNLAILTKHGYDIEPLLKDVKFLPLNSSSEANDVTYAMNKKRLAPLLVKALLVGANIVLGGLIDFGCTLGAQSLGFMETAKYLCFGAAFLFASLGSWGSLYTRARLVQAAANPVSQNAAEIAMGGLSVAQGTLGGRDLNKRLWFEDNLVFFQEAYEKSLMIDNEMLNEQDKHYDKNIGQPLSTWDIIMSHVYPIQHAIHPGFNSSFWYESDDDRMRHHGFVSLRNSPNETDFFWQSFHLWLEFAANQIKFYPSTSSMRIN